jgi:hypothetical protein
MFYSGEMVGLDIERVREFRKASYRRRRQPGSANDQCAQGAVNIAVPSCVGDVGGLYNPWPCFDTLQTGNRTREKTGIAATKCAIDGSPTGAARSKS